MWQRAAGDVFFYTPVFFPMPTLLPMLYTCRIRACCRQGISRCSPCWFNSAFPGWVPWGRKYTPKCTLEKIEPMQRPGMSSTDAVHLCPRGKWTSLDPQTCWIMSIRLKSKRQFQRLISDTWAGIALLEVRLCNPALQPRCVSQANGRKSGSILVTKPLRVKHKDANASQQRWRSQEGISKSERQRRTSWRSFSQRWAFRRSEKCPSGYELP